MRSSHIKRDLMRGGLMSAGIIAATMAVFAFPVMSQAAPTQVLVTPTDTHGWTSSGALATTTTDASVNFVSDSTAPGSPANGALQLMISSSTTSKAQYMLPMDIPLSDVNELSYSTKQNSAPFAGADASYQLQLCALGFSGSTCAGYTTMVFEPYENGTVAPGSWQSWGVMAGQFWSSRNVSSGSCQLTRGSGGAPFYTISHLQTMCPAAVVIAAGLNVGRNNASYNVEADLFDFNGTTYNFEPFAAVTSKNACKDGGWESQVDASDNSFKNQGACVSYVASNGRSDH